MSRRKKAPPHMPNKHPATITPTENTATVETAAPAVETEREPDPDAAATVDTTEHVQTEHEQETASNDDAAQLSAEDEEGEQEEDKRDPRATAITDAKNRIWAAQRAEIQRVRPAYIADVIANLREEHGCTITHDDASVTLPITVLLALTNNDDLDARIAADLGLPPSVMDDGGDDDDDDDDDSTGAEESKPASKRKASKRKAKARSAAKPRAAAAAAASGDRETIETALIEIVESGPVGGLKVSEVMPHLERRRLSSYSKSRVGVLLRELVEASRIDMIGNPPAGARYVKHKGKTGRKLVAA